MIQHIAASSDPRLTDYVGLTDAALRRTGERFIAESTVVVRRALDAGLEPVSFLLDERHSALAEELEAACPGAPIFVGPSVALEELTGYHLHRGALSSMRRPKPRSVAELLAEVEPRTAGRRSRVAVLEGLTEHTNVGAAFRSAAAFGVDAVIVTPHCADPLYRRAVRVSMGTVFQVPWTRSADWPADIEVLRSAGYTVAGMTLGKGAVSLDEFVRRDVDRLALVFGHEGNGLTPETEAALDARVTIPMDLGVDSLNVAASAAVAFYATR